MTLPSRPWLLPLDDLTRSDLPLVGAKNLGLAELARLGLRTPRGFALSTTAFAAHLEAAGIDLRRLGAERAHDVQRRVLDTSLDPSTREAIVVACEVLGVRRGVVARSSLYPFEDDPAHACAGLFASSLNLRTIDAVEVAVRECFASLLSEATFAYFDRNALDIGRARMSVGLQETVETEASATVFTEDPLTHNPSVLYIDAAHGFGGVTNAALVETDAFFIEKGDPPRIVARRKGTKRRRLARMEHGGLELLPNTQMGFALDDETLLRIARDVMRVEAALGAPQDLELSVTPTGEIVYLQTRSARRAARPIVELAVETNGHTPIVVGTSVVFGAASAIVRIHHDTSRNADAIVVKEHLAVRDVPRMFGAKGLVVRHVPPTSHPAIHLREIGVPTLSVGDGFSEVLKLAGEVATLEASSARGSLYRGELVMTRAEHAPSSLPHTRVGLHLLTAYPSALWSCYVRDSCVEGVHVRGETINNDDIRTHPLALLAYDEDAVEGGDRYLIERRIAGYPTGAAFYVSKFTERLVLLRAALRADQVITLRLTDLLTPEYKALIGGGPFESDEQNPSLGLRGAARLLHPRFRRVLDLELTAVGEAIAQRGGRYRLLVPMVRTPAEVREVRVAMRRLGLDLPLGMMVETPAAVLLASSFAEAADFFVVGAADLTQLVNGADRTNDEVSTHADPLSDATRAAVRLLFEGIRGRAKEVFLPETLYRAFAGERALVANSRLKVYTWPDRLLRVVRDLAAFEQALPVDVQTGAPVSFTSAST